MKTLYYTLAFVLVAASAIVAEEKKTTKTTVTRPDGSSQTTEQTTTSTGTITEYSPGTTFVVKESSGPVTYRYGKKVTYVTKSGQEISEDALKTRIKVGLPVSVHYVRDGENRVISRVVIDD